MNRTGRIILSVICALLILAAPFAVSSPSLLPGAKWDIMQEQNGDDDEVELDFGRLFLSTARAEEEAEEETADEPDEVTEENADGEDSGLTAAQELPLDFSVPPAPKAENFTEDGYEDESIRVKVEQREEDGVIWHLAFIEIASPTQIRTATAVSADMDEVYRTGSEKDLEKALKKTLTSTRANSVSGMARANHAVVAINGDNYQGETAKKTFEYRMGQKIRSKTNKAKDMLIIDENGDFHLVLAAPAKEQTAALEAAAKDHTIVNAFTFGPALVIDGEEQEISKEYGFNPNRPEPRSAIGQTGPLSYVCVIAEGRGESSGASIQALAHYMKELGCLQAFNLDGGNSAEMTFGEKVFKGMPGGDERGLNDVIYFATAVPEE